MYIMTVYVCVCVCVCVRQDNIKMYLKEIGMKSCIQLRMGCIEP